MSENENSVPDAQHPFQTCPPLPKAEFKRLKENIRVQGVIVPLVADDEGNVIDGHHRLRAWQELRDEGHDVAEPERRVVSDLTTQQKLTLSRALNITHRTLTNDEKSGLVDAELQARWDDSDRWIAEDLGVSHTLVSDRREALELAGAIKPVTSTLGRDGKRRKRTPATEKASTGNGCQLSDDPDEIPQTPQPPKPEPEPTNTASPAPLQDADLSHEPPDELPGFKAGSAQDMLAVLAAFRQKTVPLDLFRALFEHFEATVNSLDEQDGDHTLVLTLTPNNATAALAA